MQGKDQGQKPEKPGQQEPPPSPPCPGPNPNPDEKRSLRSNPHPLDRCQETSLPDRAAIIFHAHRRPDEHCAPFTGGGWHCQPSTSRMRFWLNVRKFPTVASIDPTEIADCARAYSPVIGDRVGGQGPRTIVDRAEVRWLSLLSEPRSSAPVAGESPKRSSLAADGSRAPR